MFKNRTCKTGKLFCPKPTCTIYMFLGGRFVVAYSLFIVAAIICGEGGVGPCSVMQYFVFFF